MSQTFLPIAFTTQVIQICNLKFQFSALAWLLTVSFGKKMCFQDRCSAQQHACHCTARRSSLGNHESSAVLRPSLVQHSHIGEQQTYSYSHNRHFDIHVVSFCHCWTAPTASNTCILVEFHCNGDRLHKNRGDRGNSEGHRKDCEHEALDLSYVTGNSRVERITLI